MERKQSELTVITKAKDLCSYVMTVTQKSPKQFRFTFVTRLQNFALSAIENLFRANDVFVSKADIYSQKERLSYQRSAMSDLKLLKYYSRYMDGCVLIYQDKKYLCYCLEQMKQCAKELKLSVKGLEYLHENSAVMKTYKGLKELRDWLPF